jgi:hypothetical protein
VHERAEGEARVVDEMNEWHALRLTRRHRLHPPTVLDLDDLENPHEVIARTVRVAERLRVDGDDGRIANCLCKPTRAEGAVDVESRELKPEAPRRTLHRQVRVASEHAKLRRGLRGTARQHCLKGEVDRAGATSRREQLEAPALPSKKVALEAE